MICLKYYYHFNQNLIYNVVNVVNIVNGKSKNKKMEYKLLDFPRDQVTETKVEIGYCQNA